MAIYEVDGVVPEIDPTAFVHPDAVVIGRVRIGAYSSIWPCAVLRGDEEWITIGDRTSIQDGSVIHSTFGGPTFIGSDCVVGHLVHAETCVIEDGCLIGNCSIVLNTAIVRRGAVVGSNAVVTNGMEVPSGALAVGVPAVVKEGRANLAGVPGVVQAYVDRAARYKATLRRVD
ncbi:MAG: gamma carbonic anhydrase family protein [Acidimicrobiia bacterium]